MSEAKAGPSKARPSKEERAATLAQTRRRHAEERRQSRSAKLQAVEPVAQKAEEALQAVRERIRVRKMLADHLQTHYNEVDKLAKGNRLTEATHLAVDQANAIIRDAKAIITGDVYLDRVKEFVPAGENPVYPDVLMVAATVQGAVRRAEPLLVDEETRLHALWLNAQTIVVAARLTLDRDDQPRRNEVEDALGEKPASTWFYKAEDGHVYFDIDRFDDSDAETLLRTVVKR